MDTLNHTENRLVQAMLAGIADDSLKLPTLPDVALRIQDMARDPNVTSAQLATTISRDTATAARLLKIANSASQRGMNHIDNLPLAISRIGINVSCNVATGLLLGQLFNAKSSLVDRLLRESWKRSQEVAAISHALTRRHTRLKPELAMLAGLTYEIGMLPILRLADETIALATDPAALDRILSKLYARVGVVVLRKWNFPPEIVNVPLQQANIYRDHEGPADYGDVVTIAALQFQNGLDRQQSPIDWTRIPAVEKLNLGAKKELADINKMDEALQESRVMVGAAA